VSGCLYGGRICISRGKLEKAVLVKEARRESQASRAPVQSAVGRGGLGALPTVPLSALPSSSLPKLEAPL
jgi:hypothetical protein